MTEARRRSVTKGGYNEALARTGSMVRGFTRVVYRVVTEYRVVNRVDS